MKIDEVVRKTKKPDLEEQVAHLSKETSRLNSELRRMHEKSGEVQILAKTIRDAIESIEPMDPIEYRVSSKLHSEKKIAAVLKLSDWHIGEVTRAEETESFGIYNWEIAQERIHYIAKKFILWVLNHRLAFNIPYLYVLCEQDFISGDIHDELRITNEFPTPVQSVRAGQLLGQIIASLAPHFPEVHVIQVGADNHSRLQKKPQAKQKALNSFGFMVSAMCAELLREHKNVEIHQSEAMTILVNVIGQKFLCEHGDTVKAHMGFPYYGLGRKKWREAFRRMMVRRKRDIGFDYLSCGHWHVPSVIEEHMLINGSLSGTSEFDHSQGRHADPSQVSFMVHPTRGIFDWTPWKTKR